MNFRELMKTILGIWVLAYAGGVIAAEESLRVTKRSFSGGQVKTKTETWQPGKTAVVVCDMWDAHHCFNAVGRVNEMAPQMNRFLVEMRRRGATVIHAPSSCVGFYKDHPARQRVASIPRSSHIPEGIGQWCDDIPSEVDYPLDQSDGGEDDDPAQHAAWARQLTAKGRNPRAPWTRQVESLTILDQDFITDNGEEVWSILDHKGVSNVMLVGVHTNMCVLGRPFGLRQLSKNGKNVVLVRDLTDTMYNPARWPFVDHFQGNRLIQRHIETYVCPTITSDQILGGKSFVFQNDRPKKCLIVCAESLYETSRTLPEFASQVIKDQLGLEPVILSCGKGEHQVPRLEEEIRDADLVILSARRRSLPESQLNAVKNYLGKGRPLVAIRTSSHAFDTHGKHPDGHAEWPNFDTEVIGGDYTGHYANDLVCRLVVAKNRHAVMTGVDMQQSKGSLYRSSPLSSNATVVLWGEVDSEKREPVAWTHQYGDSRVFYTSLGHPDDFRDAGFARLLENGIRWSMKMNIGLEPEKKK